MKKTFLVTAATLFVIVQALAQGQTPPPAQNPQPNATQNQKAAPSGQGKETNVQKTQDDTKHAAQSSKSEGRHARRHGSRRMAKNSRHHQHMAHAGMTQRQPQQPTVGFGSQQPQKLTCKKGQKPDGITCM